MSENYKRVVPWFSLSEWKAVYNLIYSENIEDCQCGLDRIVGWKARCSSLPPAVECTLGIFQVLVQDPEHLTEENVSILRQYQLRLMYSTAVMRFLNLMLEVVNDGDYALSMYSKAEKKNIPEWLVNLRHDAAHGSSLPDLCLLRAAAVFISRWLHDNYWEAEIKLVKDWVVSEEDVRALSADEEELRNIIEAWEALSLYKLTGFENLRQIPDNELRSAVVSIHGLSAEKDEEHVKASKLKFTKLSSALSIVLKRLIRFFRSRLSIMDKNSVVANVIVGGEFFLPSENMIEIMLQRDFQAGDILQQLPPALESCFTDLLSTLWELGAIPALLLKLISLSCDPNEPDLRQNMAALWSQKILLSCLKVRETCKVRSAILYRLHPKAIYHLYKDASPAASRKALLTLVAHAAVENQRPDLKIGYPWKILEIPDILTSKDTIKQAILPAPSKFGTMYLPCLLELALPAIPLTSRKLLIDLVKTHTIESFPTESNGSIHSADDLAMDTCVHIDEDSQSRIISESGPKSRWTLSQGDSEWGYCPLGVLPWQQEQDHLEKEKYENRQQLRTWTKLSLLSVWDKEGTNADPDQAEPSDDGAVTHAVTWRRVREGRIKKSQVKKNLTGTVVKMWNESPHRKVAEFLNGLQAVY